LSRGKGVPATARKALGEIETLVRDAGEEPGIRVFRQTIGLEGETRLCVEFDDEALGKRLFARSRELAAGIDLMNLVVESCSP
jgi:hypothetical protein